MAAPTTEQRNPASGNLDRLATADLVALINREDQTVPLAVQAVLPQIAKAVDGVVDRFQKGGRLLYVGSGTSGRLGLLDAVECPPTFGVPPDRVQGILAGGGGAVFRAVEKAEDDREAGARDLRDRGCRSVDSVVGISASGRTPYVLGALDYARSMGALTVSLTSNRGSALAAAAQIAIVPATGPEVVTGSTRMKAGTAQKLILNTISTAVMVRMGYVLGNLMVKVQPTNEKLIERGRRIVSEAANCGLDEAATALETAGNDVRVAILIMKYGFDATEAQRHLADAGDSLWQALESRP
ncbi:MAG: N-acetylmuramic acid 6-phosphate etherase [Bryobacterales bacterium]|nr:N-acetylmuramic acid 6-phosphate etherase [Bryobacterales bacterium]